MDGAKWGDHRVDQILAGVRNFKVHVSCQCQLRNTLKHSNLGQYSLPKTISSAFAQSAAACVILGVACTGQPMHSNGFGLNARGEARIDGEIS